MVSRDGDDLAAQLELSSNEVIILHALRLQMMESDLNRERRDGNAERKRAVLAQFHQEFLAALKDAGEKLPAADLFAADSAADLAGAVHLRSRAMILLIDLMTFDPWPDKLGWAKGAREDALQSAADMLAGVSQSDFDSAVKEFDALLRQLKRKSIKWGRVAAATAVGLGAGVLTAGWAAPVVGGAIGASLGLTGAAATSAGLALLGGGSLAAGGFGVFGGTILLTGVGGVFVAGAAGATARFSRVGAAQVMADAIKMDLLAKLVIADSVDRDQKLRRVAEGLQSRINEFSDKINLMSERIATLRAEKKLAEDDRNRVSDENRVLKEEIAKLREDVAEAEKAKGTLEVVLDRLPAIRS